MSKKRFRRWIASLCYTDADPIRYVVVSTEGECVKWHIVQANEWFATRPFPDGISDTDALEMWANHIANGGGAFWIRECDSKADLCGAETAIKILNRVRAGDEIVSARCPDSGLTRITLAPKRPATP